MRLVKLPFKRLNDDWPLHPCVPIFLSNPLDGFEIYYHTYAIIDTGAVRTAIPDWVAQELCHCHENTGVKQKEDAFGIVGVASVYEHTFDLEITGFEDKPLYNIKNIKFDVIVPKDKKQNIVPPPVMFGLEDFVLPYVDTINFAKRYTVFRF